VTDPAVVASWAASHEGWLSDRTTLEVQGTGPVSAVTGTCPTVVLTIFGIPVTVNAATRFEDGATCAELVPGVVVEVRGMLIIEAGVISVVASRIEIENRPRQLEGEGVITAISGACPNLMFAIGSFMAIVSPTTVYEGGTCADLQPGTRIEARGRPNASGQVQVTLVKFKSRRVSGEGMITSLTGTCPNLMFVVQGIRVVTNAATRFDDGRCTSLAVGTEVEVEGDMQADGTVLATKVEVEDDDDDDDDDDREVEGEGAITSLTGACPNLMIVVQGFQVMTNLSTRYEGGSCASLQIGTRVKVTGIVQANGSAIARKVEIKNGNSGPGGDLIEGEGILSAVSGTCPTRTISANGVSGVTGAETIYKNGSCASLAPGRRIRARGQVRGGTIFIVEVEFR
jgi:hypothetical protein